MYQTPQIPIAIADDHQLVLQSIIVALTSFKSFDVIITASNGEELIAKIDASETLPKICILDVNMPILNGLETLLIINSRWPEIRTLALTLYDDDFNVFAMISNGARGFLSKSTSLHELENAIMEIYNYGYYQSDTTEQQLLSRKRTMKIFPDLTEREKEFLTFYCQDLSYKEISTLLKISVRTVDYYHNVLTEKFQIQSRLGIVLFVLKTGYLSLLNVKQ